MRQVIWIAAVASLSFSSTAVLAQQSVRAAQAECFRQYGAYDEAKKKWVIPAAPYYIMASRIDAINNCVSQRTGRPTEGFLREQTLEQGRMYR